MILKDTIFRAYDLRGQAFVDFDEDGFFVVANAFGKYIAQKHGLTKPRVFLSGDGRTSMPELWPAVVGGLEAAGCNVTWGGTLPTPVNYFSFHEGNFDAAIQISASHNPPEDNGLKLVDRDGAVCGEQIQQIKAIAHCAECQQTIDFGECADGCRVVHFSPQYTEKLLAITAEQAPKKLVVDCGNAVPGIFYPEILEQFGHEVVRLYCNLNPTFPNHQPDPERPENLADLVAKVGETGADFGFAYDGDGDRVGVVLPDGTILNADKIMYVLTADYLSRHPGEKIVVDAMTSATLVEKITALGGEVILSKTGHSYIEEAMHEHGVKLGGEQSGHFMFGENFYGHDDAMLATLRFLDAVEHNPNLIDEVTIGWPELLEFSEKFKVPDEEKFEILEKVIPIIESAIRKSRLPVTINTIDGLRLDFGAGEWAIIRCSNTSPKISVRIEATDEASLSEKKALLVGTLKQFLT